MSRFVPFALVAVLLVATAQSAAAQTTFSDPREEIDKFVNVPTSLLEDVGALFPDTSQDAAAFMGIDYFHNVPIQNDGTSFDVTFLSETKDSTSKNALGYFIFTLDDSGAVQIAASPALPAPPTRDIIFPNASHADPLYGEGEGQLATGDTATIGPFNKEDGSGNQQYLGFFIITGLVAGATTVQDWDEGATTPILYPNPDATYESNLIGTSDYCFTTVDDLNYERTLLEGKTGAVGSGQEYANITRHAAMARCGGRDDFLGGRDFLLLGFDDYYHDGTTGTGAYTFHDLVVVVSSDDPASIAATNAFFLNPDSNGDYSTFNPDAPALPAPAGPAGFNDHFPYDSTRDKVAIARESLVGVLVFEDQYPRPMGASSDEDMNDHVVQYSIQQVENSSGDIKDIIVDYHVVKRGTGYEADFGVSIGLANAVTGSATLEVFRGTDDTVSDVYGPYTLGGTITSGDRVGLLGSHPDGTYARRLVAKVFDNIARWTHTDIYSARLIVTFDTAQAPTAIEAPPFDPWLRVTSVHHWDRYYSDPKQRYRPIDSHLPNKYAFGATTDETALGVNRNPDSKYDENGATATNTLRFVGTINEDNSATGENFQWVWDIPKYDWQWPNEREKVGDAYASFPLTTPPWYNTAPDPTKVQGAAANTRFLRVWTRRLDAVRQLTQQDGQFSLDSGTRVRPSNGSAVQRTFDLELDGPLTSGDTYSWSFTPFTGSATPTTVTGGTTATPSVELPKGVWTVSVTITRGSQTVTVTKEHFLVVAELVLAKPANLGTWTGAGFTSGTGTTAGTVNTTATLFAFASGVPSGNVAYVDEGDWGTVSSNMNLAGSVRLVGPQSYVSPTGNDVRAGLTAATTEAQVVLSGASFVFTGGNTLLAGFWVSCNPSNASTQVLAETTDSDSEASYNVLLDNTNGCTFEQYNFRFAYNRVENYEFFGVRLTTQLTGSGAQRGEGATIEHNAFNSYGSPLQGGLGGGVLVRDVVGAEDITIRYNRVTWRGSTSPAGGAMIQVRNSSGTSAKPITVRGNSIEISGNGAGIQVSNNGGACDHVLIDGNTIRLKDDATRHKLGIDVLANCTNIDVTNNHVQSLGFRAITTDDRTGFISFAGGNGQIDIDGNRFSANLLDNTSGSALFAYVVKIDNPTGAVNFTNNYVSAWWDSAGSDENMGGLRITGVNSTVTLTVDNNWFEGIDQLTPRTAVDVNAVRVEAQAAFAGTVTVVTTDNIFRNFGSALVFSGPAATFDVTFTGNNLYGIGESTPTIDFEDVEEVSASSVSTTFGSNANYAETSGGTSTTITTAGTNIGAGGISTAGSAIANVGPQ
jgi:LruC domain-containing protein